MLLLLLFALRALNSVLIATTFAPDEWWQGPEVAHRMVYGHGHLTWEWAAGLRSYAHPTLYAAPYWLLRALRLDSTWAVEKAPQLVQAWFAALTDLYVAKISSLLFGAQAGRWALACQLASWFNAYALVRTYSNSLEACFTAIGVYYWLQCCMRAAAPHLSTARGAQRRWLLMAALCTVFRPSSALFWLLPSMLALARQQPQVQRVCLLVQGVAMGGACLLATTLLDSWWYGRWVLAPWEFLKFNLLTGGSAQYGCHPWHWNVTQGLPVVALTLLPLLVAGLRLQLCRHGRRELAWLLVWQVMICSLPAHKEFRFLLPALQLAMPFCAAGAAHLAQAFEAGTAGSRSRSSSGTSSVRAASQPSKMQATTWQWVPAVCLALQVPVALYFCLFHHRATVSVMRAIRTASSTDPASVLFLTPCHATPYYTHVHAPLPMRFLDCSPQAWRAATERLNARQLAWLQLPPACTAAAGDSAADQGMSQPQVSQRQCFERDPAGYLEEVLQLNAERLPSRVVGYSSVMQGLAGLLASRSYRVEQVWRNCLLQTDPDTPCTLELWRRTHA